MDSKISDYNILRRLCWMLKMCGLGDFWYETRDDNSVYYRWCTALGFLSFTTLTVFELLEAVFDKYPPDLHNDAVFLGAAHVLVVSRLAVVARAKLKIKDFHKHVVEDCKSYEDEEIMKRQYRKIKIAVLLQTWSIYIIGVLYLVEAFNRMFRQNLPFFMLAVYWPAYEDDSKIALAARIFATLSFAHMLTSVIVVENLVITHFILMNHKLENLTKYFENIREEFSQSTSTTVEMRKTIQDGLVLHYKVTSSARKMQDCFGYMMSIQLMQGSTITVLVLLKIALSKEISISALFTNLLSVAIIMTQLILYMWNAGDITYQASHMSDAIFYTGWERRGARTQSERDLRRVVLMGMAQAQRPLVMKAFGIQELSYSSFVSVLRATYSLFAVMYSTKK